MSKKRKSTNSTYNSVQEPTRLRRLKSLNEAQKLYVDSIRNHKLTICTGPAGTGKTYLSTYVALEKLLDGEVTRIVITRPVVEAGEKLGFLPGTLEDKIHPYLLPVLDSFEDHIGSELIKTMLSDGRIEVAPLAFMRGRTFNHCFVILDEAENATKEQMKMFLTRHGNGSIFVVNGDETQSDLGKYSENGLSWVDRKLNVSQNIMKIAFTKTDIVRSPLVTEVLEQLEIPDTQE
jgi:phosphate starvation-inducible PhoH-like protein